MFERRTLFVLGAGASVEAGMPTSSELAAAIGKKADIRFDHFDHVGSGDSQLYEQIIHRQREKARELQQAAWLVRDGIRLSQSIDDFLDLHRDNRHVNAFGKAAIVKTILEEERKSKLFLENVDGMPMFRPEKLANTWCLKFMHMLSRGIPRGDARQIFHDVAFIIFNYDRCVEHFLYNGLQKIYGISENEAANILADCTIIHPYGLVGPYLPIGGGVPFGTQSADYRQLSQEIKTYTEQIEATDLKEKIGAEFDRAECIVFLGFAYHTQNMRLLKPAKPIIKRKPVYGTAYEMSDSDTDVVSHEMARFFEEDMTAEKRKHWLKFENKLTAADLFDHYGKSLAGGGL